MALEQLDKLVWEMQPGPLDVHTHPRVFDAISDDAFNPANGGQEGKGGLRAYTGVALRAGFVAMLAMPNEALRRYNPIIPEQTEVVPYPIANLDRVLAMQAAISQEAYIPTGIHFGLDPETAFTDHTKTKLDVDRLERLFSEVSNECLGIKVWFAESTGNLLMGLEHAARLASLWDETNPSKPFTMHVEGSDVAAVLQQIKKDSVHGKDIPIHIAHVSSREELEAVIAAKRDGMNVTCEVTPHHLFLNESARDEIGGYATMKPRLKKQADVDFIWAHIADVDMFASDCAPHRKSDKEGDNPAFGVTNHSLFLPLLLGAVADGKLTMEQLYDKLCIQPRNRFGLPIESDTSFIRLTTIHGMGAKDYLKTTGERYGYDPFTRLKQQFHLAGYVLDVATDGAAPRAKLGNSESLVTSYTHLLRPTF